MARAITLTVSHSPFNLPKIHGVRIRIEVTSATEIDDEIFAYRVGLANTETGEKRGYFSHVCSPVDIEDYPVSVPEQSNETDLWFRMNYVDVLLRSTAETQNLLDVIKQDVKSLIDSLNRMSTLESVPPQVIT